jgi:hypothetical protein
MNTRTAARLLFLAIIIGVPGFSSIAGTAQAPGADGVTTSYWKFQGSDNVVRMERQPSGEMRFWAHQLDTHHEGTRNALARRGLEIDVRDMTPEYVLRFCGFGYDNGLKYMAIESKPGDRVFQVVVAIGFDFFRGVEHPKYGDTRWRVKAWHPDENTLRVEGRLIGWRGFLTLGQIKDEVTMTRLDAPAPACTQSPIYAVKPAARAAGRAKG